MKTIAALLAMASAVSLSAADPAPAPLPAKKILFFTKSATFEHSVIKQTAGRPSFAEQVLIELGAKNNLVFIFSKDGSLFTPEYLQTFDAFMSYTTGDLTTTALDKSPAMTPAGKAALLAAVAAGKGFIGVHSATDTFHSPGNEEIAAPRYVADGDRADPFIKMIGGEFIKHGSQQPAHLAVADPKFPGMAAVPADFGPNEEWYSLKNFAPDLHVLLVQETAGMKGPEYARPPYPSTWARMEGKGRVFSTSLGHREDVWLNPVFQAVLLGCLNWATGRVEADVTPNLDKVTPQARVLLPDPALAKKPVTIPSTEKNGLSVIVEPVKSTVGANEALVLKVTYRNVSKAAFRVASRIVFHPPNTALELDRGAAFWSFRLEEVATGKIYTSIDNTPRDTTNLEHYVSDGLEIKASPPILPSAELTDTVELPLQHFRVDPPDGYGGFSGLSNAGWSGFRSIPMGAYKVIVTIRFPVKPAPDNDPTPLWLGDFIESAPVEITEITTTR